MNVLKISLSIFMMSVIGMMTTTSHATVNLEGDGFYRLGHYNPFYTNSKKDMVYKIVPDAKQANVYTVYTKAITSPAERAAKPHIFADYTIMETVVDCNSMTYYNRSAASYTFDNQPYAACPVDDKGKRMKIVNVKSHDEAVELIKNKEKHGLKMSNFAYSNAMLAVCGPAVQSQQQQPAQPAKKKLFGLF